MRISDLIRQASRVADLASHTHTLTSMVGSLFGKEPPEDAPPLAKGLHGALGRGDERAMQNLLVQLEKKKSGSRDTLTRFFRWLHPESDDFWEQAAAWWRMNELRSFISSMGVSHGSVVGSRTQTVDSRRDGARARTRTQREIRSSGVDNRLVLLGAMVDIIRSEENEEAGFRKLRNYLEAHGILHSRDAIVSLARGTARVGEHTIRATQRELEAFADTLEERQRKRETGRLAGARSIHRRLFG